MANAYIDNALAADLNGKLWEWARRRAVRDRDMSAALDIMRHFAENNLMLQAQADAAQTILRGPEPAAPPAGPAKEKGDPGDVLERLSRAGMLRGRNGQKAMNLLEQRGRWSPAQLSFAASIASDIEKSAIIYVAVKEIAEESSGNRFAESMAESMVESFDEWGSYTAKQQDAACAMVERETGSDPLKAAFAKSNGDQTSLFAESAGQGGPRIAPPPRAQQAPLPLQSGPDDDDIPF